MITDCLWLVHMVGLSSMVMGLSCVDQSVLVSCVYEASDALVSSMMETKRTTKSPLQSASSSRGPFDYHFCGPGKRLVSASLVIWISRKCLAPPLSSHAYMCLLQAHDDATCLSYIVMAKAMITSCLKEDTKNVSSCRRRMQDPRCLTRCGTIILSRRAASRVP